MTGHSGPLEHSQSRDPNDLQVPCHPRIGPSRDAGGCSCNEKVDPRLCCSMLLVSPRVWARRLCVAWQRRWQTAESATLRVQIGSIPGAVHSAARGLAGRVGRLPVRELDALPLSAFVRGPLHHP